MKTLIYTAICFAALQLTTPVIFSATLPEIGTNLRQINHLLSLAQPNDEVVYIDDMGFNVVYLRKLRNALMNPSSKAANPVGSNVWPSGRIPYSFAKGVTSKQKKAFRVAAKEWSDVANLNFFEDKNNQEESYLLIKNSQENSSMVGKQGPGPHKINISSWKVGIICHELGHALGLCHEHSRFDRETFIDVREQNIQSKELHNFIRNLQPEEYLTDYDFGSIMHYSSTAFPKQKGLITISPRSAYKQMAKNMGQRKELSPLDKEGMALIYGERSPEKATSPTPADDSINQGRLITLNWLSVSGKPQYHVYFGQNENLSEEDDEGFHENSEFEVPYFLAANTSYFWRIDTVSPSGTTTIGDVWSFTTNSEQLPGKAGSPTPSNNSTDNPTTLTLDWVSVPKSPTYRVYLSNDSVIDSADDEGSHNDSEFKVPYTLNKETTYYWRVDTVNSLGTTLGDLWKFTTKP